MIKSRFDKKIINNLDQVDFNNMPEKFIKKNIDFLYKPLTQDVLGTIVKKYKKQNISLGLLR